jgi:hypothetical protein
VEIAAKIHEPSMQFPQYNCRVLYPRVSSLYETEDRSVEAMFVLKKITDPLDKYYLVLTSLSEHQADLVSNVMEEEPDTTSYAKMKAALISTNTLAPYQMVDRLIAMEPLGGQEGDRAAHSNAEVAAAAGRSVFCLGVPIEVAA